MISKKIIFMTLLMLISIFAQNETKNEKYPSMGDRKVKNVILMIGDGMGIGHVAAVRLQRFGKDGRLNIEKMPVTGIVNTHSTDNIITDSAAGATAMSTGYKTNNGMIGMTPDSLAVKTIMEAAKEKGMKTGLVATSSITHATPASFVSHIISRDMQYDIARQMIESDFDVMMGGGKEFFVIPRDEHSGNSNGENLIKIAEEKNYEIIYTKEDLYNSKSGKLLGLFSYSGFVRDESEPTLSEMTAKALDILGKSENGFFLMVEGSQIDWEAHDNNLAGVQKELLAFDIAINTVVQFAMKNPGTLVLVTADHETGGLIIDGGKEKGVKLSWASKHHSGLPVGIFAFGPYAMHFTGVIDNTDIPRIIAPLLELKNFPQKKE